MLRTIALRAAFVIFGLLLALIIVETTIRLLYGALPMGLQIALRDVQVSPFSDQRLAPPPLWQSDSDYLTIVRPGADNSLQAGSPTVTFRVSTYAWWGGRVGFRSPQPQDGRVEATAVGDSFTFCFTDAADCWVTKLEQATGLKIANLGQPVTGSTSHARIYYDFVAKPDLGISQPKLVLWEFYGNDFNDDYGLAALRGEATTPAKPTTATRPLPQGSLAVWLRQNSAVYMLISTLLRGTDPGVAKFVDPHHVKEGSLDLWFGQSYIRDAFDLSQPRNQEGIALTEKAISETRDIVEKNGGKFVVVLMPAKEEVYRHYTEPIMSKAAVDAIAAPRLKMLELCQNLNLLCVDVLPVLEPRAAQGEQLYFPADPHLNAAGNAVVAEVVQSFLKEQKVVD